MATRYVTLKDSNGDTIYPQAIATNLAAGSIGTTELADGAVTTAKIAGTAVTDAKIDWSTTSRPVYYKGTDWATSWTFKYNVYRPQLIFVAWQSSTAMFVRIYDSIYKVCQTGTSTVTSSVNTTAKTWTISTSNTGVLQVLEINNTKTS